MDDEELIKQYALRVQAGYLDDLASGVMQSVTVTTSKVGDYSALEAVEALIDMWGPPLPRKTKAEQTAMEVDKDEGVGEEQNLTLETLINEGYVIPTADTCQLTSEDSEVLKEVSKAINLVLRHRLDQFYSYRLRDTKDGYVYAKELIKSTTGRKLNLNVDLLYLTYKNSCDTEDKPRFGINEDRSMIRALQGHTHESVDLDKLHIKLTLDNIEALFDADNNLASTTEVVHCTARRNLPNIFFSGLFAGGLEAHGKDDLLLPRG